MMTDRVPGQRPAHVKAPAHLSPSPPVPAPGPDTAQPTAPDPDRPEPTRYGDWEKKGIAIDF